MVLGRFSGGDKSEDVSTLIAKKNYTKAIEVIREQLQKQRNDPRLRLQLADVLVSAGKGREAVTILLPLADEFAKEGFAAKAISVLKKIQKLDPGRRDIDSRLANLIQEKQKQAVVIAPAPSAGALEIGMEEIGFEPPPRSAEPAPRPTLPPPPPPAPPPEPPRAVAPPVRAPAPPPAPAPSPAPPRPAAAAPPARPAPRAPTPSPEPELELEATPELDLSGGDSAPTAPAHGPVPAAAGEFDLGLDSAAPAEEAPLDLALEPMPAEPAPAPAAPVAADPVVDQDLFTGEFESVEPIVDVEPIVEPEPVSSDPMTDSRFADELFSVLENAFQEAPAAALAPAPGEPQAGAQIVVSPLFHDFSVEELVAVIGGLNLLTFERGNVIIREGEPGDSLYMLTSGTVKAFVRRDGKQVPIGELDEGAFFGEVSILTGRPRTATIVAKAHCELLELDRGTLDSITQTHPHVLDVLKQFAQERMARKV